MTSQALNRPVAWFCDRDGKTVLTSGFVAENKAYVEAHKDCNWRPLPHPDLVAELIAAGDFLAMNGTDGMVRRWEAAKAAIGSAK